MKRDDKNPLGYTKIIVSSAALADWHDGGISLLLPESVALAWDAEKAGRTARSMLSADAVEEARLDEIEITRVHNEHARKIAERAEQFAAEEMARNDADRLPAWCKGIADSGGMAAVPAGEKTMLFQSAAIAQALAGVQARASKDNKDRERMIASLKRIQKIGGERQLSRLPQQWRSKLRNLEREMPNFAAPIQFVRHAFAVAEMVKRSPALAPMLLDGPPGIGKTMFARKIAALLGTGFMSVSMETAQTATELSGSEEYWGNSKPGRLYELLVSGQYASPVVLVDEVEKARAQGYDPASALYQLLEPTSAASWHDLSVPYLALNASHVVWILTSNDKLCVAKPLLSRMKVFDIPTMTPAQSLKTARAVFAGSVAEMGLNGVFKATLPEAVAHGLSLLSPREMHVIAREMIGKVVDQKRREVRAKDMKGIVPLGLSMMLTATPATPVPPVAPAAPGSEQAAGQAGASGTEMYFVARIGGGAGKSVAAVEPDERDEIDELASRRLRKTLH